MIDHTGLQVSDLTKAKNFYRAALAPLGYGLLREFGDMAAGFGDSSQPVINWTGGNWTVG